MKSVKITEEAHQALKIIAAERGGTLSRLLNSIVAAWLEPNTRNVEVTK
jgi:hypothetical protein